MIPTRIIPCLLVQNGGLVKTVKFSDGKYVGDPINAVRIFNEKEADEIMVLDISATAGDGPNLSLISRLAAECRMPLCYGGGISDTAQALEIFKLGVEKVAISSGCFSSPNLIKEVSESVGSQSVVCVVDVKKSFMGYDVFINNGKKRQKVNLVDFIVEMQKSGVGEIVINSIDRDGTMAGYDLRLVDKVRPFVRVPLTILGGAGSLKDMQNLVERYGVIGCGAGSMFVFRGKYKAVLISYPQPVERWDYLP